MGLIGLILSFTRVQRNGAKLSDVKVDLGGGDIITAEYAQPSGSDTFPIVGDYAVLSRVPRSGGMVVVATIESDALQSATAGDHRIYSRSGRTEAASFWLKSDGTAITANALGQNELRPDGSQKLSNAAGFVELLASGTVNINGVTISPAGLIITPTGIESPSVKASGKELAGHLHPAGVPPGNTGANI